MFPLINPCWFNQPLFNQPPLLFLFISLCLFFYYLTFYHLCIFLHLITQNTIFFCQINVKKMINDSKIVCIIVRISQMIHSNNIFQCDKNSKLIWKVIQNKLNHLNCIEWRLNKFICMSIFVYSLQEAFYASVGNSWGSL